MVLRNKEDGSRKDKDEGRLCERCGGHRAGADGRDTDTVQQRTSHKLEKMQYKGGKGIFKGGFQIPKGTTVEVIRPLK